eukprot:TRINITY_DN21445_c0_g1_i1.p1 TRINITY_DN21445_c0_g1~~TRINITY_DN21445_c0_g1_i1.p1  ORF type:complete len:460 (-),score=89.78 TRINITY_DN21445_c0_g1_i1:514-1893(-)
MSRIAVLPNPRYSAEVIVLLTTLGAKRAERSNCLRTQHFLEVKRAHSKVIDFNRDVRVGRGSTITDGAAVQRLFSLNPQLVESEDEEAQLPQIFLDGWYIGGLAELQALEDDGLLGRLLRRELCFNCNGKRVSSEMWCSGCGAEFEEVLAGQMTLEHRIKELQQSADAEADSDDDGSGSEAGERFAAYKAAYDKTSPVIKQVAPKTQQEDTVVQTTARFESSFKPKKLNGETTGAEPSAESSLTHLKVSSSVSDGTQVEGVAMPEALLGSEDIVPNHWGGLTFTTGSEILMEGYLWKKSTQPMFLRLRAFKQRYFVAKGTELIWWATQEDAEEELFRHGKLCLGFIKFHLLPVKVVGSTSSDTSFTLKPKEGTWVDGSILKDNADRDFTFDTDSPELCSKWVEAMHELVKASGQNETDPGSVRRRRARRPPRSEADDTQVIEADAEFYELIGLPVPENL